MQLECLIDGVNKSMDEKCYDMIKDYVRQVDMICEKLLNGINEIYNEKLYNKMDFLIYRDSVRKMEFRINDICYRLHGRGCTVVGKGIYLDWEFGYRSRWCGIDPWKVAHTLKHNSEICYDDKRIREVCDEAVEAGLMCKINYLYYFTIPEEDKYKPDFPDDFDTLEIERKGQVCSLKRNKEIERFIRKSVMVNKNIQHDYLLKFLKEGMVVFSINYDDIGFPESAVKIMSDNIIRNNLK